MHLKENLTQTHKCDYSSDDEEHALGLCCMTSCIYDEHREPSAVISTPKPILYITDDRVAESDVMAIKAAREVTLVYGGFR